MNPSSCKQSRLVMSLVLALVLVGCLFVGESMAGGKGKGNDESIM